MSRLAPSALLLSAFFMTSLFSSAAQAQSKNEVGLVIGATVTPNIGLTNPVGIVTPGGANTATGLTFNSSLALGAEYDRRLLSSRAAALFAGVDFLASPLDVKLDKQTAGAIPEYAYAFWTPHVRVKFAPEASFSPWLVVGGGYARFRESTPAGATQFHQGTNTGALEVGGGIDTKPLLHVLRIPIGFRVEVRDFYSGIPNYNISITSSRQNNVVFTGGLLLRF